MSYKKSLLGAVFNSLKVIKEEHTKNTHTYWRLKCKLCNSEKILTASSINFRSPQCNICYRETRVKIKKHKRLLIISEYLAGTHNNEIMDKYHIKRYEIYKVLKFENIEPTRNGRRV